MGDTPLPSATRRRQSIQGARSVPSQAPDTKALLPPSSPPSEPERDPGPDDRIRFRRLGRWLLLRGERGTREGDFASGAIEFERAAWAFERAGEPLAAAEATLELGRCLLFLRFSDRLASLADRIEKLSKEGTEPLPIGGRITLRVWAAILRRGENEPGPLLTLIRVRRGVRQAAAAASTGRTGPGGLPLMDTVPPHGPIAPIRTGGWRDDDWSLSPEGAWFVLVLDGPSAVERVQEGRRIVELGRSLDCSVTWEIERRRVVVKVTADHRGYALLSALREETRAAAGAAS